MENFIIDKFYNKILPIVVSDINSICLSALKDNNDYEEDKKTYIILSEDKIVNKIIDIIEKHTYNIYNKYGNEIIDNILSYASKEFNIKFTSDDIKNSTHKQFTNLLTWYVRADNTFTGKESHYYYEFYNKQIDKFILVERTVYNTVFVYIGSVFSEIVDEYMNN